MASTYIGLLLYLNLTANILLYRELYKARKLIGFQLGMNISILMGGVTALCTGVLLISQFPFSFTMVTIISTVAGMAAGGAYGALFDYQTLLTGYANGLMIGLMAPMIGSIIDNDWLFICFMELLLAVSSIFVISASRRA
ncbi:hypothetical protein LCM00_20380 [Bacillus infantis]|uniref:hypothetical protein n=1 Tax=Bacillus infantis TaxID=324767 RepID=UPI001CD39AE9|nr:hypothetical protein [Bacillus infantis]MCA1041856.1 hypothetical protein [Bacillus infantis]